MPIHDWTRVNGGIFHHFHHRWIAALSDSLNAGLLPPDYYALAGPVPPGLRPDASTLAPGLPTLRATASSDLHARKRSVVVVRHADGDDAVAVIQIVSPANKGSPHDLRSFVRNAVELLEAGVHLLLVDLFPPGPRDPQGIHAAVWSEIVDDDFRLPTGRPLTLAAYSAGEPKCAYVEALGVRDCLPEMPLFLEPEFYVPVPLEPTYRTAFDAVPKRWRDELESPTTGA